MAEQAMAHGLQSRSKTNGSIELILGPMFSGKTTELFRRIRRYTFANYKCAVVKYKNDQRYSSEKAATHDKVTLQAYSCIELSEVDDLVNDFDVIAIDEGQFFPDLVGFCEKFANLGKILIVGSLDGTFQRKPFGNTLDLIPLSESITKLSSVCMVCFRDAAFTKRITTETQIEVIGGQESYISVCRSCFHDDNTKLPEKRRQPTMFGDSPPSKRCKLTNIAPECTEEPESAGCTSGTEVEMSA
eukprot:980069_1